MTSATDELRRLLDERGVEWTGSDTRTGFIVDGIDWEAYEHVVFGEPSGLLSVMTALTPAQAIDATLGRGTCHIGRGTSGLMHVTTGHCSECGAEVVKPARYCPNCGRKVEP